MKSILRNSLIVSAILAGSLHPPTAGALEVVAGLDLETQAFSNVFLDGSQEWDLALKPSAELGLDFGTFWSAGYTGELSTFTRHPDLLSHWHEVYLFANPAWGENGENELALELSAQTLRNDDRYSDINLVRPGILARLEMEPRPWMRWQLSAQAAYRWFYDDKPSNSLDIWARGQLAFMLPSRTSLFVRAGFGMRSYTNPDQSIGMDESDKQAEAGIHLGQSLSRNTGLQLDYAYLYALDDAGVLTRLLTLEQFSYLGESFLFSGHRASVGLKHRFEAGSSMGISARYEERAYAGWPAIDRQGRLTGQDRIDRRLTPGAYLSHALWSRTKDSPACAPDLHLAVNYRFIRQWSNSDWYNTSAHQLSLSLWGSW